jgi:hypothetical protein
MSRIVVAAVAWREAVVEAMYETPFQMSPQYS